MKKLFILLAALVFTTSSVLADELKVNIGIESGDKKTEVVAADVYATIDGKPVEITVSPEDMAFKMNGKFGALHIKSFWATQAKMKKLMK